MSTSVVTPENPFDTPLPSEVQEHQQTSAAKVAAGGNPFDEPLPSEKAEANLKANPEEDASQTRQMLVSGLTGMPTPNMSDVDKARFETGKAFGAVSVPVVAGAVASGPVLEAIGSHLKTIKSIIDMASKISVGAIGYREARELWKEFSNKGK